jgi:hypothetical protein
MDESATPTTGLCLSCNYSLQGLESNRCPECGREFNPNDPWTMNMGRPIGPKCRALLSPMGKVTVRFIWLSAFLILWGGSWMAGGPYVLAVGALAGVVLIFYQAIRANIGLAIARIYRQPYRKPHWKGFVWPIVLAGILTISGISHWFAVWIHRPLLDRYAHHIYAEIPQRDVPYKSQWIGLFYIRSVRVDSSCIIFLLSSELAIEYQPSKTSSDDELRGPYTNVDFWSWWSAPARR